MDEPLYTVVETPEFLNGARRLFNEADRAELVDYLASHPTAGVLMREAGGARKLRWGARSKGKRGGARVITFYAGPGFPVFVLAVFGKGEKVNISKAERNELRQVLSRLVEEYRAGEG